jgi:hypothetical protein
MPKVLESVRREDGTGGSAASPGEPIPSKGRALELVAARGKEVIGVKHLLRGGRAWVGDAADALARVAMADFGGEPVAVGEVSGSRHLINVPPRARIRIDQPDNVTRIAIGPQRIALAEGERAVVVLGSVQIRAQVVAIETFARTVGVSSTATRWIVGVGAVYMAALALCAVLAPRDRLEQPDPASATVVVETSEAQLPDPVPAPALEGR